MWLLIIVGVVAGWVCVAAFVRGASALNSEATGLFATDTQRYQAEHRDAGWQNSHDRADVVRDA